MASPAPAPDRPIVVGILNLTPDSFHDGGRHGSLTVAVQAAEEMIAQGADWIDIGGESTRPGAAEVDAQEELRRVLPLVTELASRLPISIDTRKPEVARRALRAGASILNDVSGLALPEMAALSADFKTTVVMHMRGEPATMREHTRYEDLLGEVCAMLVERASRARSAEVWIDPGIGFAKTARQSARLLAHTDRLVATGLPVLIGASRKSFLGQLLDVPTSGQRLVPSLAAAAMAWQLGARAFRVHDVGPTRQLLDTLWAMDSIGRATE